MHKEVETICNRIRLKPNSLEQVYAWANELKNRESEVYLTLEDEGVYVESVFLERTEEGDFLIYYMRVENLEKTHEVAAKSTHAIDAYHQKFKKATWESGKRLELLVDFETKK